MFSELAGNLFPKPQNRKPATVKLSVENLESRIVLASSQSFQYWATEAIKFKPVELAGFRTTKVNDQVTINVDWGDGSKSTNGADVTVDMRNQLHIVHGTHLYKTEGPYKVKVTATEKSTGKSYEVSHGEFGIYNAALKAKGVSNLTVDAGKSETMVVASFTDTRALGGEEAGYYEAEISWGFGPKTKGRIRKSLGLNEYMVLGECPAYKVSGNVGTLFNISVKILETHGGKWKESTVFCNGRDNPKGTGGMVQVFGQIIVKPVMSDLDRAILAIKNIPADIWGTLWDFGKNIAKFMTSNADMNQKAIIDGITKVLLTPLPDLVDQLAREFPRMLDEARDHPGRLIGNAIIDYFTGKAVNTLKGALKAQGRTLKGVTDLPDNFGTQNFDPDVQKYMKELAKSQGTMSLAQKLLTSHVQGLAKKLQPMLNPNPAATNNNCILVSIEFVNYMRNPSNWHPAPTISTATGLSKQYIVNVFGKQFGTPLRASAANEALKTAKNADFGVIGFGANNPGDIGHFMNWINVDGRTLYVDIQAAGGRVYTWETLPSTFKNSQTTFHLNLSK